MNRSGVIVKIVAAVALLFVVTAVVMYITKDEPPKKDHGDLVTPDQLVYGLNFEKESTFDVFCAENYYKTELGYVDYRFTEEYTMVYQAANSEELGVIKSILGVEEEFGEVDFEKEYLLFSTGRKIKRISTSAQSEWRTESPVYTITYSEEYSDGVLYVYSMNPVRILSGADLEKHYWEKFLPQSNLVELENQERQVISEGAYHSLYLNKDGRYEYELVRADQKTRYLRFLCDRKVNITEYSVTLIKVEEGDSSFYYNAGQGAYSERYDYKTDYLIYNIITYLRVKNSEVQLILRDAYDSTFYAKIISLPFVSNTADLDSLIKNIEVVDDTHITVEFSTGNKQKFDVYNLKR